MLAFAAEHRVVLSSHVQALLGISDRTATGRLNSLTQRGLMRTELGLDGEDAYLIQRRGLAEIDSELPRPRDLDPGSFRHDVGLAWVWLAARAGAFGAVNELVSERRMRSADGRGDDVPYGVRLGGVGPHGGTRRHYPDLLLETVGGHRVAVELELTGKARTARERILGGYAIDNRIDAVLYLARDERIARAVRASARAVGISDLVHIRTVSFAPPSHRARSTARTIARARRRPATSRAAGAQR